MSATYGAVDESDADATGSSPNSHSLKSTSTVSEDFTSKVIGDFGPWQLRISIMMALLKFPLAWCQLGIVFLAPQQEFWCKKPESISQYSVEEWRVICKPRTEEHPCMIYDPEMFNSAVHIDRDFIPMVHCKQFEYDNSTFSSTITSEWNLVCGRSCLVQLSQVVLMWGILVGNVIFGLAADKYGRKNLLVIAIIMQSVCSLLSSLSPWFWLFTVLRFFMAIPCGGTAIISFVMCMEIVSGKYRTIIPIVYQIPFGCGNTVMAVLAYYLRHWRRLEFTLGGISALYAIYHFHIPESPRWLLAKGRRDQAIEILKQAAATNHRDVEISEETMSLLQNNKAKTEGIGFIGLLKYKNMRLKTILLSLNWLFTGMNFYAFSQYMGGISNNIFLTVALGGIISTPGSLICIYIVKHQGRKMAIAGSQIFTGLCFLMLLAVPKDVFQDDYPRIIISGLGLAGMAISVPALYLFTGEIYPTLSRNIGVGGCSMFARIGSMLSPVLLLLQHISEPLPLLTLAASTMLQAAMMLPLPETKDCALPDTIEQAEKFDKRFSINYRREKKCKRMMRRARTNSPENLIDEDK